MTFDNTPIGGATIGCCICLNLTGEHVPAVTLINGYAVCAVHVAAVSGEFTDFAQLIGRIRTQGEQT